MNKSIQRDVRGMLCRIFGKTVSSIHPISGSHAQNQTRTAQLANAFGNNQISSVDAL
jgi:hypothetical protein